VGQIIRDGHPRSGQVMDSQVLGAGQVRGVNPGVGRLCGGQGRC
jgi:hypothetical protein